MYLLVTSIPLRDHSLTVLPLFSVIRRKPSHLVSKTHALSLKGLSTSALRCGMSLIARNPGRD